MPRNANLPVLCCILSIFVGCSSTPTRNLSESAPLYAQLPNGNDPLNPEKRSALYLKDPADQSNVVRKLEKKLGRPLNLLSLSGGGQNGAFGAGFLIGWRETGRRPQFDMVGGVSTGALLATHALLGTPEDDARLEEMYTQITKKDIYKNRSIFSLISGADSLKDTKPLRKLIAKHITAETLKRVASAYEGGRSIWVGTTNIDYDQTWVWNMSEIAKDGNLELYHKVLLASASFPIVFPPVEIDGHLFVDGAARSNLVVGGLSGESPPGEPPFGPGNFYLIDNGKLDAAPQALKRALGNVAATTVSVMMNKSMQSALMQSYAGAKALGYNFNLVGIAPEVNIGNDPLAFDPEQMRAAFDAGRELAKNPDPWAHEAPTSDDLPDWINELIHP